jgi:hypothetical protein
MNMHWETHSFGLPAPPAGKEWRVAINTGMPSPLDISPARQEPPLEDPRYILVRDRAIAVLVARPVAAAS